MRTRKNATNGGQSVSPGSSATGWFEDTTGTDTIAAGDKVCLQFVPGAATGTLAMPMSSTIFDATTNTVSIFSSTLPAVTAASTTYYMLPHGTGSLATSEANQKFRVRNDGTWKNFGIFVSANRATTSTLKSRVNGADGTMSVSITGGATGWFEDTSHSDTVVVGDDINYSLTTSTGVDTMTTQTIKSEFVTTDGKGLCIAASNAGITYTDAQTRYTPLGGSLDSSATETDFQMTSRLTYTYDELIARVIQNDIGSASTIDLRDDAASTALTLSVTANTTGIFNDGTHTFASVAADKVNYRVVAPSVSGTHTIQVTFISARTSLNQNLSRTLDTETVSLSESIARVYASNRSLGTETTSLSESTTRAAVMSRPLGTETTSLTEDLTRLYAAPRTLDAETTNSTEDLTRIFVGSRSLSTENTTSGESLARLYASSRTLGTETTNLSENIETQFGVAKDLEENVSVSDDIARLYGANRQLSTETTSLSESLDKVFTGTRTLATESTTSSENLERVYSASRTLSTETTSSSEELVRAFTGSRTLPESTSLSEDLARLYNASRPLDTETTSLSESITRAFAGVRTLPETVSNSESLQRLLSIFRTLGTETTSTSDSIAKVFTGVRTLPTETVTSSESLGRVYNAIRNIATQVISVVDDLVGELGQTSSEFFASLEETVTTSDSINRLKTASRTIVQTTTITSSLNRVLNSFRSLSDTTTSTESLEKLRNVSKQLVEDTISITDSIVREFTGNRVITELILSKSRVVTIVNNFAHETRTGKPYLKIESKSVKVLDVVRKYGIVAPKRIIRGRKVEGKG